MARQPDFNKRTPIKKADKYDDGKPPMWLLPGRALMWIARVLAFGAVKYAANNWRKGMEWSKPLSAIQRHAAAMNDGEFMDADSGCPHLACIGCEVLFLLSYWIFGLGENDMEFKDLPTEAEALASAKAAIERERAKRAT